MYDANRLYEPIHIFLNLQMEGIPEQSDGALDPLVLEARSNCTISERIHHQNWKVRKDVYDELINDLDTLDETKIQEEIRLIF